MPYHLVIGHVQGELYGRPSVSGDTTLSTCGVVRGYGGGLARAGGASMPQHHLDEDYRYRGTGEARAQAVRVDGVRCQVMLGRAKERFLLDRFGPPAGGTAAAARYGLPLAAAPGACRGWHLDQQLALTQDGRRYHLLLLRLADASERLVWFDVTAMA
jgi:hypothetical protein